MHFYLFSIAISLLAFLNNMHSVTLYALCNCHDCITPNLNPGLTSLNLNSLNPDFNSNLKLLNSDLNSNLKLFNSDINSFNPSPNHIHNLNTLNLTLYQLNLNRNHDLNPLNLTLCQINLNHNHDLNPLNLTLFQTNLNPLNLTLCQINLNHNHDLNPFNLTLYQLNLNHNPLNLTLCQINHYPIHLNILVDPSLLKLWSMKPHLPLAILVETPKLKFQYSPMGMGKSLTDILVNNDGYIKKLIFFGLKRIFSGLIPTN
jgi:hypothetical protein